MSYSVRYKKVGGFFWKTLKNVKGDLSLMQETSMPIRVLILEDERRMEIPALTHVFEFSRERFEEIRKQAEKEAGQKIPVNS